MSKILSVGLKLTAIDRLTRTANEKKISGKTVDEISQKLDYKSFQDFVEKEIFGGASIPKHVLDGADLLLYETISNQIEEIEKHKVHKVTQPQIRKIDLVSPKPKDNKEEKQKTKVEVQKEEVVSNKDDSKDIRKYKLEKVELDPDTQQDEEIPQRKFTELDFI